MLCYIIVDLEPVFVCISLAHPYFKFVVPLRLSTGVRAALLILGPGVRCFVAVVLIFARRENARVVSREQRQRFHLQRVVTDCHAIVFTDFHGVVLPETCRRKWSEIQTTTRRFTRRVACQLDVNQLHVCDLAAKEFSLNPAQFLPPGYSLFFDVFLPLGKP